MLMKVEYRSVPKEIVEMLKDKSMQSCTLIEKELSVPVLNTNNFQSIYIDEIEVLCAHEEEIGTTYDIIVSYFITDTYPSIRKEVEHNKEKISVSKPKKVEEKLTEQVKIVFVNNPKNLEFEVNHAISMIHASNKDAIILDIDIQEIHNMKIGNYMIIIKYTTKI